MNSELDVLGLNPDNSVVIGSGILGALNIRESKNIDVVVIEEKYKKLTGNSHFEKAQNHGREILLDMVYLKLERAGLLSAKLGNLMIC